MSILQGKVHGEPQRALEIHVALVLEAELEAGCVADLREPAGWRCALQVLVVCVALVLEAELEASRVAEEHGVNLTELVVESFWLAPWPSRKNR